MASSSPSPAAPGSRWVPDSEAAGCMVCARPFTLLKRRRHHCRVCGKVVCADCSPHRVALRGDASQRVRVCTPCHGGMLEARRERQEADRVLYATQSPCPACAMLERRGFGDDSLVPAEVHQRGGRVWLDADCPQHGRHSTLVCSSAAFFGRVSRYDVELPDDDGDGGGPAGGDAGGGGEEEEEEEGGGEGAPSSSPSPPPPVRDVEDLAGGAGAGAGGTAEPHHPTMVEVQLYQGGGFTPRAEVERTLKKYRAKMPPRLQYVVKLTGGLVPVEEIPALNSLLLDIVGSPLIGSCPAIVDLSFERMAELAELHDSVFLKHGNVYPSLRYFLRRGEEATCVEDMAELAASLATISDIRLSVVLCVDRPFPNLAPVMEWLLHPERRGLIRVVTLSRERSPREVLGRLRARHDESSAGPAPGAAAGGSPGGAAARGGAAAQGGAGAGGAGGAAAADEEEEPAESTDPYELLQRIGAPGVRADDFVPARFGMILEPFLRQLGYGEFRVRPAAFCGFMACLGPDGQPLSRQLDLDKLYFEMLPVVSKMRRRRPGLWAGKAIRRAVSRAARGRMPEAFRVFGESQNEQAVRQYVRALQFIIVHNNMDFASVDMKRRRQCAVLSGPGAVAACTGCL